MLYVGGASGVIMFAFVLYCVLDVVLAEPMLVRNLPKITWLFLIIFLPLIGGIAWLVAGRPETAGAAPGSRVSRHRPYGQNASTRGNPVRRPPPPPRALPPAPKGPDDDEDFLRRLDEQRPPDDDST